MGQRDVSLGQGKLGGGIGLRVYGGVWIIYREFKGVFIGLKSQEKVLMFSVWLEKQKIVVEERKEIGVESCFGGGVIVKVMGVGDVG